MTMRGQLSEMTVADLIQHACLDGRTTRISLQRAGEETALHIYIENGKLVHAEMGDRQGEQVVFEVLGWQEGTFALESDVLPPAHTIERNYAGVLLEGMRLIDEGEDGKENGSSPPSGQAEPPRTPAQAPTEELGALLAALRRITGVAGVVIAARDGVVIAHDLEDNPDKSGAIAVFVGLAAGQVGEKMAMGPFQWATVVTGKDTTLIIEQPDYFIGLLLTTKASPALVASQSQGLLR